MSFFSSRASRIVSCILYLLMAVPSGLLIVLLMSGPKSNVSSVTVLLCLSGPLLLALAAVIALVFGFRTSGYVAIVGGVVLIALFVPFVRDSYREVAGILERGIIALVFFGAIVYPIVGILALRREIAPESESHDRAQAA